MSYDQQIQIIKEKIEMIDPRDGSWVAVRAVMRALPVVISRDSRFQNLVFITFRACQCANVAIEVLRKTRSNSVNDKDTDNGSIENLERSAFLAALAAEEAGEVAKTTINNLIAPKNPAFNTASAATDAALLAKSNYNFYMLIKQEAAGYTVSFAAEAEMVSAGKIAVNALKASMNFVEDALSAIEQDLLIIKERGAREKTPLWHNNSFPKLISEKWEKLSKILLSEDSGFHYWINWYEERLEGKAVLWEEIKEEILLPKKIYSEHTYKINAFLSTSLEKRLLFKNAKPPETFNSGNNNINPSPSSVAIGRHCARIVTGKLNLDFEDYALAIARVMQAAKGEFSMALLGNWGAGKTTLVRGNVKGEGGLESLLTNPELFSNRVTKETMFGRAAGNQKIKGHQYEVAWFSAWKYRRVPETWAFLYETLAKKMVEGARFDVRLARVLRTNVAKLGGVRFVIGASLPLIIFAIFSILKGAWAALVPVIGSLGFLLFLFKTLPLLISGPKAVKEIMSGYASVATHNEKLGIQALIGEDLKALLLGWIPEEKDKIKACCWGCPLLAILLWGYGIFNTNTFFPALAVILFVAFVLSNIFICCTIIEKNNKKVFDWLRLVGISALTITFSCYIAQNNTPSLGVWASAINWLVWSAWSIPYFFAFFLLRVKEPKENTERILLVIDDLDRCSPEESIEILEQISLLLQGDEEIAKRIQILVLADETVLKMAVEKRFENLIDHQGKSGENRKKIYREHMEKLFLSFLRLPAVPENKTLELLDQFIDEANGASNRKSIEDSLQNKKIPDQGLSAFSRKDPLELGTVQGKETAEQDLEEGEEGKSEKDIDEEKVEEQISDEERTHVTNDVFTPEEKGYLNEAIQNLKLKKGTDKEEGISARQLKLFLFQYQLARDLFSKTPLQDKDAKELSEALALRYFKGEPKDKKTVVNKYVEMVSLH